MSDAGVAEVPYTAFTSTKGQAVTARLIVRRVRDLNKQAAAGQDELFPLWRYDAVFTDSPFELIQAEGQHRDHAIVEQIFADVTDGPLAHMPSGSFPANAAWHPRPECSYETACQAFAASQLAVVPVCTVMYVSSGSPAGRGDLAPAVAPVSGGADGSPWRAGTMVGAGPGLPALPATAAAEAPGSRAAAGRRAKQCRVVKPGG